MTDDKIMPLQHRARIANAASSRTVSSSQAWNLRALFGGTEYSSSSPATVYGQFCRRRFSQPCKVVLFAINDVEDVDGCVLGSKDCCSRELTSSSSLALANGEFLVGEHTNENY
jgi:hypothetical protein